MRPLNLNSSHQANALFLSDKKIITTQYIFRWVENIQKYREFLLIKAIIIFSALNKVL
jgi:hypothetical protein